VSEELNRKLPARNTTVQLLVLYTDPERYNAQRYRRTDGQTDGIMMPTVRSAKNLNLKQLDIGPFSHV